MGQSGPVATDDARPVRIELLVIELMNLLLDPGPLGIDRALGDALARLGVACGLDRTFLFRTRADGAFVNSHEWTALGVFPLKDSMPVFTVEENGTWRTAFEAGQTVVIPRREDLPRGLPERIFLEQIGVHSSLMLPLMDGARCFGMIGFDSQAPDRHWGDDEHYLLTAMGRAVSSVLLRDEAAQAEAATRSHLQAILRALPDLVIEFCPGGHISACHSDKLPWLCSLVHAGLGRQLGDVLPEPLSRALMDMMRDPPDLSAARTRRVGLPSLVAPHWYDVSIATLPADPSKGMVGYISVIRDLSSSQASSEMSSYREGQFTAFFEMCPHPILLSDFDSGELLDANRAFKQVFGIDPQQALGITVRNILPEDAAWVTDSAAKALKERQSFGPFEASLRGEDGTRFPAVLRGFLSVDPNGRRLVWALIEDVTEIRAKEAALVAQQSYSDATRARLVSAIEALDDGFAIFDAEDRLVLWNLPYVRIFAAIADLIVPQAHYDDLLRAAIARGVYGARDERDEAALQRRLNRPAAEVWDSEDEFADGRLIWVTERATPQLETVGFYEDVTDWRLTDLRLQQVVDSGDVTLWDWDHQAGLNTLNTRWREALGLGAGHGAQADLLALIHHDDLVQVMETRAGLTEGGKDDFDLLCRVRHAKGHWFWLLSRGRVLARLANGQPRRISGVSLDVTARIEAEQRLSRLIDGARVGTWEHDLHSGETLVNDRWAEILGFRAADLNPMPLQDWLDIVHPDDAKALIAHEDRCFAVAEWEYEHELRVRHRQGHWVWVLTRTQAIEWDAQGKVVKTSGVNIDVSAAKALEFALARERDTLARIMETSVSGIVAVDDKGRVVFSNAAAEAVLGRRVAPPDDLTQIFAAADVTDKDGLAMPQDDHPLTRALAGLAVQKDVRLGIRWPDGARRVLTINVARLSAPGTDLAVLCSLTDITDAVQGEDRLRAAMIAAEAASRAKSDFLATMSHEMRTPLNGVLGMVEVLDRTLSAPGEKAMLGLIRDSGEHLLSVINDILDLAKIEAGHLALDPGPIDLADVVDRVASIHRVTADEKGVTLTTRISAADGQAHRFGDEKRLIQILHNLVGNAIKFTEAGSVTVVVDASSPARLGIEVADTGIGMSEAEMARAFEGFTQGQTGIARRYGGTGLGLSIVQRLTRLMQGEVALSSAPGQGLVVRVDLAMPVLPKASDKGRVKPLPQLPPMRVLAAEDNATNRIILVSMLEALGVTVEVVTSGDEVLEAWRPDRYDAVLLDIAMPGRDGLSTLHALRDLALSRNQAPPQVIAITANAMTHQVQDYLAHGFLRVVAKPLRPDRLAEALLASLPAKSL
jgi:PAS domain S-box-containing protein